MQVRLAAVLVGAVHAALEDGKHVLNRVGVDREAVIVADIFAGRMLHRFVLKAGLDVVVEVAFVGQTRVS